MVGYEALWGAGESEAVLTQALMGTIGPGDLNELGCRKSRSMNRSRQGGLRPVSGTL